MADVIKTIGAAGADYTTIPLWWAARTGGAGDNYIGVLTDAAEYNWGEVATNTTFAANVILRADTAVKLDLSNPTATHAKIASTTGSALFWRPLAPLTVEDIELTTTASSTCFRVASFEDTNVTVRRCLIRGGSTGISHGRATATTLIENCVVTGADTWGISNGFAGITVRNTVVAGNNTTNTVSRGGMRKDIAGTIVDNVVCFGNLRADFHGPSTAATVSYLASGDASATGANALTGVTSAAFTNYAGQVYTAANGGALDGTAAGGADRGLNLSAADIIAVTSPYDWQFFARNKTTNTGSIAITGTYSGSTAPTSIEARWNGGAWTVITASPSGGTFSGTLTGLTSGNGTLEVRYSNATAVTDSVDNVAIGAKLLFWGQSNFSGRANNPQTYTGTAGFFHKYTVTNNLWQQGEDPFDTDTASGSLFPLLANQLVSAIGCPVAFIGVAAGSTTLSQWQSGQALNTRMLNYIIAAASDGLEGICSWIGESDAGNATSETTYKAQYNAVIDQLKTLTGVNSMLVAISGLALTDYANVRQWIKDIAAASANVSDIVPEIWPLYQKIHYETDIETALAADAVGDGLIASFYNLSASVDFIKSNLTVVSKTLNSVSDSNVNLVKNNQTAQYKTLSVVSDSNVNFIKTNINVSEKTLTAVNGSSVDAAVSIPKGYCVLNPIALNVSSGSLATLLKFNCSIAAKIIESVSGSNSDAIVDLIKTTRSAQAKLLSVGRLPHPISKSRIFTIKVDARTFTVIN